MYHEKRSRTHWHTFDRLINRSLAPAHSARTSLLIPLKATSTGYNGQFLESFSEYDFRAQDSTINEVIEREMNCRVLGSGFLGLLDAVIFSHDASM